jgi:putative ABC transport system permease protein
MDSAQIHPLRWKGVQTALVGLQLAPYSQGRELVWIKPPPAESTGLTSPADGLFPAWISESFQERFGTRIGDSLELPTPTGPRHVRVSAVFADYGNERGSIAVDRRRLAAWLDDANVTTLAVYLKDNVPPDAVRRAWMAEHPGLTVRSNARLREEVMLVFRQTFSVTHTLKGIAVVVAIGGLALALVGLLLERRSELLTLKELGMTRAQLAAATGLEGVWLAALGTAVGLGLSLALGWLLIFVINKQSFGWTLAYRLPWFQLLALGTATLLSSWAVAWMVGWWGATLPAEQED